MSQDSGRWPAVIDSAGPLELAARAARGLLMLLLKDAEVFSPASEGRADILIAGGRVERIDRGGIRLPDSYADVVEAGGLLAVPGFIDSHVHITGGGGEGGYATRTPELQLSDAVRGGVTTVVGCLGTDGVTRSLANLLAKARGLEAEGITAFIYTGYYAVPVRTITGSIERDLQLIDKVIGVGEVALSDHRSTQPTFDEFARLAGEARRGGILSGKAGVVNVHMGDGHARALAAAAAHRRNRDPRVRSSCRRTSTATRRCSRRGSPSRRPAGSWTSRRRPSRRSWPTAR